MATGIRFLSDLASRIVDPRHGNTLRKDANAIREHVATLATAAVLDLYKEVRADWAGLERELQDAMAVLRDDQTARASRAAADRQGLDADAFRDLYEARERRLLGVFQPLEQRYGATPSDLPRRIETVASVVRRIVEQRYAIEGEPKAAISLRRKLGEAAGRRADAEQAVRNEQKRRMSMGPAGFGAEDRLPALHAEVAEASRFVEELRRKLLDEFAIEVPA